MMKILFRCVLLVLIISNISCTSNEVKEISGTILFKDIGSHIFNINADNIEATITMVGPNDGEMLVLEGVELYRTSNYSAKIAAEEAGNIKTELLDNLVVMYEVDAGENNINDIQNLKEAGYIKIDWKGLN